MNAHILDAKPIASSDVVAEAKSRLDSGWRFVTMSVIDLGDGTVDILYHYDKDNKEFEHLRMNHPKDKPIPSISSIYFCALLIENETRDFFDVTFDGLVLDYNRTMFLSEKIKSVINAPFCRITTAQKASQEG